MMLYREALALGLDQEDIVIRRRLGQKLEFLSADLLEPDPPGDGVLRAYFAENIEKYRGDDLITLTHIYFDPDKRGDTTLVDAEELLADLLASPDAPRDTNALGDRFLLPAYFAEVTLQELARQFGTGFAEPVFELEPKLWHGPVLSGYGTHLVYIHRYIAAPEPVFDELAQRLTLDWLDEQRAKLNKEFTEQLIAQYDITVERPASEAASTGEVLN